MTTTLLLFLGASIALTITPGPDNLFVITQGISRGRKAAIITAWGMCSGITVHTVAAAAGRIGFQMIVLDLIFMVQALIIFTLIGFFSGSAGEIVLRRPPVARYFSWLPAGIFASLGLRLVLIER